jgi:hypothetical protein
MTEAWMKWRWDGLGLGIAGLCLLHCVATVILAILLGVIALGKGLWDHGFIMPAVVGGAGLGMMGGALTLPHGGIEIMWTMCGVVLLALGHYLNYRASH